MSEENFAEALDNIIGEGKSADEVTWQTTDDEKRRIFIFRFLANPDLDPIILVENMEVFYKWLKDGELPTKKLKGRF